MTDTILVKGIVQYSHLIKPSSAKGSDNLSYNTTFLIPVSDVQTCALIDQTFNAVTANGFPNGAPAGFKSSWSDVDPAKNPTLAGQYKQLKISRPVDSGQPDFVDESKQPIIDPGADGKAIGKWAYANVWVHTYTQGSVGVKCRPNAVMLTNEQGSIPMDQLTEKPSIDEMFATIGTATTAPPVATMAPPPVATAPPIAAATMAPPPAAAMAPPPVATAPRKVMTDSATTTYEAYIKAGWTDQLLIDNGFMIVSSV